MISPSIPITLFKGLASSSNLDLDHGLLEGLRPRQEAQEASLTSLVGLAPLTGISIADKIVDVMLHARPGWGTSHKPPGCPFRLPQGSCATDFGDVAMLWLTFSKISLLYVAHELIRSEGGSLRLKTRSGPSVSLLAPRQGARLTPVSFSARRARSGPKMELLGVLTGGEGFNPTPRIHQQRARTLQDCSKKPPPPAVSLVE